jgi:hypothetical protein
VHLAEIFYITFECVAPFERRHDGNLVLFTRLEDVSRRVRVHGVAEVESRLQTGQSIRRQRIDLAWRRPVMTLFYLRAVAIEVPAIVGHIAADVCNDEVHRAAAIQLYLVGRDALDIVAVKAARVRVHIREDRMLVYGNDPRIRFRWRDKRWLAGDE